MALSLNKVGRHSRRQKSIIHKPMSEINVTPFVDVVLVLLIIFIVAAPLLTVGVQVQLPETAATPLSDSGEEPLTLSITADGQVSINKTEYSNNELIPKLRSILAERTSDKIFLRGDKEARYEIIMQVMGALNNAGFRNISLVTDGGGPTFDQLN
ncbi:MAG: ExbD/TolR family protein [Paracoccaceae bacterium]|nr:ExbD/TolR family protein [Paracoccaceae bacterium]MDE2916491.1 ExbD/TolR family protein [Paracoccaceae bacterium]